MKSSAGPNPKRRVDIRLPPSSMGLALISTPLLIKNPSNPGPTKLGNVVVKLGEVLGAVRVTPGWLAFSGLLLDAALFCSAGGYVTGEAKRPVMDSPWL